MNKKEEQRLARKEEKEAAIRARGEGWRTRVEKYFEYLHNKYGFGPVEVEAENWWEIRVIYRTTTIKASIIFSIEFQRVEIELDDLQTEKPPYHTWLDNILTIRAPHLSSVLYKIEGLRDEQVEASLQFLAQALDEYATDVLRGDFSIFAAIEEENVKRAQRYRQREQEEQHISNTNLRIQFSEIIRLTDFFCSLYLNNAFANLCSQLTMILCQQEPSLLNRGRSKTWACSIIHALSVVNRSFENEQIPLFSEDLLTEHFKISKNTMLAKSRQIRAFLQEDARSMLWTIPSVLNEGH